MSKLKSVLPIIGVLGFLSMACHASTIDTKVKWVTPQAYTLSVIKNTAINVNVTQDTIQAGTYPANTVLVAGTATQSAGANLVYAWGTDDPGQGPVSGVPRQKILFGASSSSNQFRVNLVGTELDGSGWFKIPDDGFQVVTAYDQSKVKVDTYTLHLKFAIYTK